MRWQKMASNLLKQDLRKGRGGGREGKKQQLITKGSRKQAFI